MRNRSACGGSSTFIRLSMSVALGALLAGCSMDSARFADDFYTNAIPARPSAPVSSAYPGDPSQTASAQPGVDRMQTSSVSAAPAVQSVSRAPVTAPPLNATSSSQTYQPASPQASNEPQRTFLPVEAPKAAEQQAPATQTEVAAAPAPAKPTVVSTASKGSGAGWSAQGGTTVVAKAGDTVDLLSRRYGVPAKAIMEANGLSSSSIPTGQSVLIPSYVYSLNAAPAQRPASQAAPAPEAAVATASSSEAVPGGRYVVASGDTLSAISRRTGASVNAIRQVNNLSSDSLSVGQSLIIPGLSTGTTEVAASAKPVDPIKTATTAPAEEAKPETSFTPPTVANKAPSGETQEIASIEEKSPEQAPAATGVSSMRWPAKGRIITGFKANDGGVPNEGIDISVPQGTAVKAAENGVVIYAGDGLKELGKTVLLRHDNGIVTVYGHADSISVKRGDKVTRGQDIALSGMSGSARVPKLHFEVRKNTTPVDPVPYLQ